MRNPDRRRRYIRRRTLRRVFDEDDEKQYEFGYPLDEEKDAIPLK